MCKKRTYRFREVNAIMGNSEIAKAAFDIIISGIIGNLSTELLNHIGFLTSGKCNRIFQKI